MQTRKLLSRLDYSTTTSVALTSPVKTIYQPVASHLPLMKVRSNFKEGRLLCEGDWHFMMSANRHAKPYWFNLRSGRVVIEADIYPAGAIDLDDPYNDGLVFPLQGVIKDGSGISSCSGLIVLDRVIPQTGFSSHRWDIVFYICDYQIDQCEIRIKLPVYLSDTNEINN